MAEMTTKEFILAEIISAGLVVGPVRSDVGITEVIVQSTDGKKLGRLTFMDSSVLSEDGKQGYRDRLSALKA